MLGPVLEEAVKTKQNRADNFFKMLSKMVESSPIATLKSVPINICELFSKLQRIAAERPILEKSQRDYDDVMAGLFSLLRGLVVQFPEKKFWFGQEQQFLRQLLHYLFEIPKKTATHMQVPGPKCKSSYSRQFAFQLLLQLTKDCEQNLSQMLEYLWPMHLHSEWRTRRYHDWNIQPKINEKSSTGYVGLKNLGCSNSPN